MSSCNNKEWKETTLGEMLTFQRGFDITKKEQQSGPYQVISSSGPKSTHCDFKVKGPGVIIGRKGTLGNVFYSARSFWPHDTTLWVKDFHGNYEKFAYYFLQTMKLEQYDCGASNPTINRNHIHSLTIRFPQLTTQKKIASILSNYDDLIENNTRRIEILEQMAKLVYEEWFVKFRFPGHENVKMVSSELGEIPEGWEIHSIEEITTLIKRGVAPKYEESSNEIVINQKCIRNFRLSLEESRRHISKVPPEKHLIKGDVLINSTGVGTLGRVTQVLENLPNCTVDSHVTIVRPERDLDLNFFGLQIFRLQSYFESQGRGATGQAELGRDTIQETKVIVAPKEIQNRFSNRVDSLRSLAMKLDKKNQNLRKTRDLLLPKLISGEIDVSDLDISIRNEYQEHNSTFGAVI